MESREDFCTRKLSLTAVCLWIATKECLPSFQVPQYHFSWIACLQAAGKYFVSSLHESMLDEGLIVSQQGRWLCALSCWNCFSKVGLTSNATAGLRPSMAAIVIDGDLQLLIEMSFEGIWRHLLGSAHARKVGSAAKGKKASRQTLLQKQADQCPNCNAQSLKLACFLLKVAMTTELHLTRESEVIVLRRYIFIRRGLKLLYMFVRSSSVTPAAVIDDIYAAISLFDSFYVNGCASKTSFSLVSPHLPSGCWSRSLTALLPKTKSYVHHPWHDSDLMLDKPSKISMLRLQAEQLKRLVVLV